MATLLESNTKVITVALAILGVSKGRGQAVAASRKYPYAKITAEKVMASETINNHIPSFFEGTA